MAFLCNGGFGIQAFSNISKNTEEMVVVNLALKT